MNLRFLSGQRSYRGPLFLLFIVFLQACQAPLEEQEKSNPALEKSGEELEVKVEGLDSLWSKPFYRKDYSRLAIGQDLFLVDSEGEQYPLAESLKEITPKTKAVALENWDLKVFPEEILQQKQVEIIFMRGNEIEELPSDLGKLNKVKVLDLAHNKIEGEVPEVLAEMPVLEDLDLSHNQLTSATFSEGYPALKTLNLSNNRIERVHRQKRSLRSLEYMDLQANLIKDELALLQEIEKEEVLDLRGNPLTSKSLKLLTKLKKIDLRLDEAHRWKPEVVEIREESIEELTGDSIASIKELKDWVLEKKQTPFTPPEDYVYIPKATFWMGKFMRAKKEETDEEKEEKEKVTKPKYTMPYLAHQVRLSSYYIAKKEVTFEEFDRFCEAKNIKKPSDNGWGRGRRPVINITWQAAKAYADWLSEVEGRNYRLPTEAEWEYAAKGGAKSQKLNYAGSNFPDYVAWYNKTANKQTQEVGRLQANELGLYDMSGNVWEYCEDWYHKYYYEFSEETNPQGPKSSIESKKIIRGGSWFYGERDCRVYIRRGVHFQRPENNQGFRLVCIPPRDSL